MTEDFIQVEKPGNGQSYFIQRFGGIALLTNGFEFFGIVNCGGKINA